ncbi:MAG TPA: ABC transporter permease [Terriglobales bacterium]|nr:ABC transporter permease [Terriglobales bacterium]
MNGLIQDLRYALRQLRKSPAFTIVAVLTLAIGIGANTGMFTLVNTVLLKSLPVPNPEQLYLVRQRDRFAEQTRVSYPLYERMLNSMPASATLAAMTRVGDFYFGTGISQPEMTKGQLVSGNFFETFGTYAVLGRLLTAADNRVPDANPVAVISYGCWKRRLSGDPNVIGRELLINGVRFTVVGVAAKDFFGIEPGKAPDFWLPLMMQSSLRYAQHYSKSTSADQNKPWVLQDDITWLSLLVRAVDSRAIGQVSGTLNQAFSHDPWQRRAGDITENKPQRLENELELVPGGQGIKLLQREFERPLTVLMGMVGLLLLIACANLAGLLLARATARTREIAVRLSIGATRTRLARQLLTECIVLSSVGGLAGIAVAYWCDEVLPRWASGGSFPIPLNLSPDFRVLLFSTVIVIAAGTLFGLAPAMQATAIEPMQALKTNATTTLGTHRSGARWSRQSLVVAQFALSLVLLVGAGLFVRTLQNFAHIYPGFDRDHILTVWLDTSIRNYSHDQLLSLYQRTLDRVEALPGVKSASLATCGLSTDCRSASDIYLPGRPDLAATPQTNVVSTGYFNNVGMSLLNGRDFTRSDTDKSPLVAVISQTLARQLFPNLDPIGQRFGFETKSANQYQIVGVISDAQVNSIREAAPPMIYFPLSQAVLDVESLDVNVAGDPSGMAAQVRQVLTSIDPDLPIGKITTLREQASSNLAQQRLIARLTSIFGGLALSLTCLGLYGVMSFMVARRTAELGLRLALGASRRSVLWLVLREILILVCLGLTAGLLLSLAGLHAVSSLLFGLSPYDPVNILAAATLLVIACVASGLRPARRAAKVDPMVALRYE